MPTQPKVGRTRRGKRSLLAVLGRRECRREKRAERRRKYRNFRSRWKGLAGEDPQLDLHLGTLGTPENFSSLKTKEPPPPPLPPPSGTPPLSLSSSSQSLLPLPLPLPSSSSPHFHCFSFAHQQQASRSIKAKSRKKDELEKAWDGKYSEDYRSLFGDFKSDDEHDPPPLPSALPPLSGDATMGEHFAWLFATGPMQRQWRDLQAQAPACPAELVQQQQGHVPKLEHVPDSDARELDKMARAELTRSRINPSSSSSSEVVSSVSLSLLSNLASPLAFLHQSGFFGAGAVHHISSYFIRPSGACSRLTLRNTANTHRHKNPETKSCNL